MRIHYLILWLCLISLEINAQTAFNFGRHTIGESRIPLALNDFKISNSHQDVQTKIVADSLQWIRNESNLLIPQILVAIMIKRPTSQIHLETNGLTILPVKKSEYFYTELFIDLFNPGDVAIFDGKDKIDTIIVSSNKSVANKSQLIDYSCAPYNVRLHGLDDDYLSIGCKLHRQGKWGEETPRLELTFSTTNLRMQNGASSPYKIYLQDNGAVELTLIDREQKEHQIKIEATLPKRLQRLKTAFGFGPYSFKSAESSNETGPKWAPSVMLYGKLDLTDVTSLKVFDALLYSKTLFNNSGLYFSYDLAEAFDSRLVFNALLGFQGLHFRYDSKSNTQFRLIYPQGFEVTWKHLLGKENLHLTYGMFISTDKSEDYTNAWIRVGTKTFWEINYIDWKYQNSKVSTWGLSMGIPLANFF